jgi:hypothetical protein
VKANIRSSKISGSPDGSVTIRGESIGPIQVGNHGRQRRLGLVAAAVILAAVIAAAATGGQVPDARAAGTLHAVKLGTVERPM